jgi:hypothetical protein
VAHLLFLPIAIKKKLGAGFLKPFYAIVLSGVKKLFQGLWPKAKIASDKKS